MPYIVIYLELAIMEIIDEIICQIIKYIIDNNITLNVIVEANIGAGKSTFLRLIDIINSYLPKYAPDLNEIVKVNQEPVDMWEKTKILKLFYENPEKYAYVFQSLAFILRLANTCNRDEYNAPITITERSVYADKYCFAENLAENGTMNTTEITTYNIWHEVAIRKFPIETTPDVIVYLYAEPETCQRRQRERARESESEIPLEYFQQLHSKHENWLRDESSTNAPVYVINLNDDSIIDSNNYQLFVLEQLFEIIKKYGKNKQERQDFNEILKMDAKFPTIEEILTIIEKHVK